MTRPQAFIFIYAPGQPGPKALTFFDGPGQPGPQAFTFIDTTQVSPAPNHSLLLARPLTSISQTPHFYLPGQAALCQTVSGNVCTCAGPCHANTPNTQYGLCRRVGVTLTHP